MLFTVGQRWVSQSEPKLGLGIITAFENRRVTISFPASNEVRTYASENAPISRVMYKSGDDVTSHDDQNFTVTSVNDSGELIKYSVINTQGETETISEVELNCFIQFTSPLQRLVSGHYDRSRAFRLRYETLQHKHRLQQSTINGLLGSRTNLLPHQIYIADKVAKRHAPRVLLADEVGLGKTIEAGMILHAQLHNGLANRALIVVPTTLIHQWLIEMLRRFNLRFSIFDRERFNSLIEEGIDNPFETEQLILCDQDFLVSNAFVQTQAIAAEWDLLVVDEAHHLHWSEEESSPEYRCIEALAEKSRGVLLLTATPEQAGLESHFARLRLLDPDRFHSLSAFIEQEQNYESVSSLVGELQALPEEAALPESVVKLLGSDAEHQSVTQAIQLLLDQHGTGRILFRNTRQAVKGFPNRILNPVPLSYDTDASMSEDAEVAIKNNPRVMWLTQFLKDTKPEKVLIICASAEMALALENYLRLREGMLTAAFHEGLSIIERDRAAAFFAEEGGAQSLICSEIGSEGRNFQFAHHLVLFDLPDNPDLLEQRIGRLDRIGQKHDIQIHVPYIIGTMQEGLFHWYDQALDAFTHSCAAGYAIYEYFYNELAEYLEHKDFDNKEAKDFIASARLHRDDAMAALQTGRDPLLELNSCDPIFAAKLIEQIESEETSAELSGYMERQFNLYGVEQDHQSDQTLIIHPGEHMLEQHFPGLSEDGNTLTFHRMKALVREDVEFVTWEHPMVSDLIEQTLSGELGNAALSTISVNGVEPGTLFLEAIFALNSMAPKSLQLDRFLPVSPQRIVVNITGRDLSEVLPHAQLNELCKGLKRSMAHAVIKEIRNEIDTLLTHAQAIAEKAVPDLIKEAERAMEQQLGAEIQRLITLQAKNPLIRDDEIEFLKEQKVLCQEYINKTGLEVQAMRMVINT